MPNFWRSRWYPRKTSRNHTPMPWYGFTHPLNYGHTSITPAARIQRGMTSSFLKYRHLSSPLTHHPPSTSRYTQLGTLSIPSRAPSVSSSETRDFWWETVRRAFLGSRHFPQSAFDVRRGGFRGFWISGRCFFLSGRYLRRRRKSWRGVELQWWVERMKTRKSGDEEQDRGPPFRGCLRGKKRGEVWRTVMTRRRISSEAVLRRRLGRKNPAVAIVEKWIKAGLGGKLVWVRRIRICTRWWTSRRLNQRLRSIGWDIVSILYPFGKFEWDIPSTRLGRFHFEQ